MTKKNYFWNVIYVMKSAICVLPGTAPEKKNTRRSLVITMRHFVPVDFIVLSGQFHIL